LIVAKVDKEDLLRAVAKLEENLGQEVRYTVLSEEEFRYRQAISDAFVFNLFKSKHLLLLNEISSNE
jgi:DNA polymerase III delta subunit